MKTAYVWPLRARLGPFFEEARRLIDQGDGVLQDAVRALATEGGLRRIQELVEYDYRNVAAGTLPIVFTSQMLPFLEIVTSPTIFQSMVLENAIGTIYNVLYGPSGMRGMTLLTFLADMLSGPGRVADPIYYLELSLIVFWHIIKRNSFAFIHEPFKPLATKFEEIFKNLHSEDTALLLQTAWTHLEHILRHLDVGSSLSTADGTGTQLCVERLQPKASFVIQYNPPGGRHDNDFKDICDIQIMPTFGEILSSQSEYLPVKDPRQWHVGGISGLLDRNFRLLREDTVGQLRDAIFSLKSSSRNTAGSKMQQQQQLRTHVYNHVRLLYLTFDRSAGPQFDIRINQPIDMKKMSKKKREDWWQRSKRLQPGALVCLVGSADAVFCTVSRPPDRGKKGDYLPSQPTALWDKNDTAIVKLELAQFSEAKVELVLSQYKTQTPTVSLVEFPGVLLPSFEPTLRALQTIKENDDLPFTTLLSPLDPEGQSGITIPPPPAYSLRNGFAFDLSCLLKNQRAKFTMRAGEQVDIETLQELSTLDKAQAVAVVNTLQRSIGLIQGPPGTGKSYTGVALTNVLIQALRQNRKRASGTRRADEDLGPIICVCYTNHALDQFLEDLLEKKITTQIVRIGSRSKSEILEQYNLRKISVDTVKTRAEKGDEWQLYTELDEIRREFSKCSLKNANSEGRIKNYLSLRNQQHFFQFYRKDDEGFKRQNCSPIQNWLQHGETTEDKPRSVDALQKVHVDFMSWKERQNLHNHWVTEIRQETNAEIIKLTERQQTIKSQLDNVHAERSIRCLRDAHVIGVTTTSLAKNLGMFRRLRSKIVLCEEAGEVLESHLLTALLPSIEHLILIGDHLQLRPQVQNHDLSRENHRGGDRYSLDVSLFERLVIPDEGTGVRLPFITLETQRRMHPSIAQLVRETLYSRLEDAQSVLEYPEIDGMRKRLFWLDHRHHQGDASKTDVLETSHWNDYEVDMTVAIVNHLIRQGTYKSNEIAVLTPYLCQLHILRDRLRGSFAITLGERDEEDLDKAGLGESQPEEKQQIQKSNLLETLRVATIDNFQGEEAKVVVISLVRSNDQNRCGFLRTSNRINVLLSRAKHGMFIIGNSKTSIHVPMWAHIIDILQRGGNFGTRLELQCPRHPDDPIFVSEADDFVQYSPEGGCNKRCVNRLKCGHACQQKCHSAILHDAVYCQEPCPKSLKNCDHICPGLCGDPCPGLCTVNIYQAGRELNCGHIAENLPCWQSQDLSLVTCLQPVEKQVPGCNHKATVPCHLDVTSSKYSCNMPCQTILPCGHTCRRKCSDCTKHTTGDEVEVDHGKCLQVCGRNQSTCIHACQKTCHGTEPCAPCEMPCEIQCVHSKCPKRCAEPCAPCAEASCQSSCPHSQCSMPCAAPCDHIPCSERCKQLLPCGHRCPSVCGEVCPPSSFCQQCASPEVKANEVDFILAERYAEINLDENPCIFPRCGHVLTVESMDGLMDMKKYYRMEDGKPVAIQTSSEPFSVHDIKRCASCRGSLRDLSRYGRLVRRAILDESTKRFLLYLNREYMPLLQMLPERVAELRENASKLSPQLANHQETIQIHGSRDKQFRQMRHIMQKGGGNRWKEASHLRSLIVKYYTAVDETEQPFARVQALVESARKRKGTAGVFEFDGSVVQTKGVFLATSLLMRLDIALLGDFLSLYQRGRTGGTRCELTLDLQATRNECINFISRAREAMRVVHETEGYIFLAQLHALERTYSIRDDFDRAASATEAQEVLESARQLCQRYPDQTRGLDDEISDAETMLRSGTFFSTVTSEERMAVVTAMARELRGTGHWYYCENGHPFTIGQCGGAVELATCPECGARVGGQGHRTVEGVTRANDLEQQLRNLTL